MEYIPDGISKEQWAKIKAKEAEANKGKNLGAIGKKQDNNHADINFIAVNSSSSRYHEV